MRSIYEPTAMEADTTLATLLSDDTDGEEEGELEARPARSGRALRNKMARERRKRRKQARQRLLSAVEGRATGPGTAVDFSTVGLHSSRVGQAQETKLKHILNRLSSFSMVQHGYTRNSAVVVSLLQDILDIVPGRPTAARASVQGVVEAMPKINYVWKDSLVPKVLDSFASGTEGGTCITVISPARSARSVPLGMLAKMDAKLHNEQFYRRLSECRELLPQACQPGEAAERAKQAIGQLFIDACFYGALVLVGQPLQASLAVMGPAFDGKPKNTLLTFREALFIWNALGVDHETHARMWQVYLETVARQEVLFAGLMAVRARVFSILAAHDAGSCGVFVDLLEATNQLLVLSQRLMALQVSKTVELLYMLDPCQAGIIAATQLPRTSLHAMMTSQRHHCGPLELLAQLGDPATLALTALRAQQL